MEPEHTSVLCETDLYSVDSARIGSLAARICALLDLSGSELCVSFVDDERIAELNQQYRQKPTPTDVLSFPQQEWPEPRPVRGAVASGRADEAMAPMVLGDVVIAPTQAAQNANNIGQGLDREIAFLLVHGILHLAGYDHESPEDEAQMLAAQKEIMTGLSGDEPPMWQNCVQPRSAGGSR